ncbi:MAG: hypothetical protein JWO74_250 [Solirubrobacterales bacterium]|nr:hypothetical protein [Solirubrobacterales bacterium]
MHRHGDPVGPSARAHTLRTHVLAGHSIPDRFPPLAGRRPARRRPGRRLRNARGSLGPARSPRRGRAPSPPSSPARSLACSATWGRGGSQPALPDAPRAAGVTPAHARAGAGIGQAARQPPRDPVCGSLRPARSRDRRHNGDEPPGGAARLMINRRRPTLPGPCGPSTIGAEGLNCSVRNGKRCFPLAIATGNGERPLPGPFKTAQRHIGYHPKDRKKSVKPSDH